jgi:von Willebrand factor type A domain
MAWPAFKELAKSPLTDPRSLVGSLVFHGALLLAASLVVLGSFLPRSSGGPPGLLGAVDEPVDNRADVIGPGGNPGELGGTLTPDELRVLPDSLRGSKPTTGLANRPDPVADALVDDILDVPLPPSAVALPETLTSVDAAMVPSGVGVVPGLSTGGGGGQGGGSGGGSGRGLGAGTEFFGARERAESFAYVIDCSASMTNRNSISIAKRELLSSLRRLPPDARFGVVLYNEQPTTFLDPNGQPRLMTASAQNKARFEDRLSHVSPDGGTDHDDALLAGFALKPEVIFFLTDADLMTEREAQYLAESAGSIRIQAVEFGVGPDPGSSVPLRDLATATGGSYRYIDVMSFPMEPPTQTPKPAP